ncbi:MAG TPA: hypothetical protein PLY45_00180 [bacterium]|nr:hypothetical protein [bacterium]
MTAISEKVIGFANNVAQQVKDAIEPAAVGAIERNLDALDSYVSPVVLSTPAKTFAGYAAGCWGTAAMMVVGLPDFAVSVMKGEVGLTQIVKESWAMFKQGFTVWGDFAVGNYSSDPFERGQVAGQSLFGAMLVAGGARGMGKGALNGIRAVAESAAKSMPPPAVLAGIGGMRVGAASVSIDGAAVASAAGDMGSGLVFMSGEQASGGGDVRDVTLEIMDYRYKWVRDIDHFRALNERSNVSVKQVRWKELKETFEEIVDLRDEIVSKRARVDRRNREVRESMGRFFEDARFAEEVLSNPDVVAQKVLNKQINELYNAVRNLDADSARVILNDIRGYFEFFKTNLDMSLLKELQGSLREIKKNPHGELPGTWEGWKRAAAETNSESVPISPTERVIAAVRGDIAEFVRRYGFCEFDECGEIKVPNLLDD